MFFNDYFNSLRESTVPSVPPSPQPGQKNRKDKKVSGTPLFLLRFFLFFIVLAAAWGIYELELSFEGRNIGLLVVLLPLGWALRWSMALCAPTQPPVSDLTRV